MMLLRQVRELRTSDCGGEGLQDIGMQPTAEEGVVALSKCFTNAGGRDRKERGSGYDMHRGITLDECCKIVALTGIDEDGEIAKNRLIVAPSMENGHVVGADNQGKLMLRPGLLKGLQRLYRVAGAG